MGKICVARLKLHLLSTKGKEITLDFKYSLCFQALSWLFWSQALQCNECCLLFVFEQCPICWHSTLLRIFCPLTKEQQRRASNNTRELSKSQAWDFSKKTFSLSGECANPWWQIMTAMYNVTERRVQSSACHCHVLLQGVLYKTVICLSSAVHCRHKKMPFCAS